MLDYPNICNLNPAGLLLMPGLANLLCGLTASNIPLYDIHYSPKLSRQISICLYYLSLASGRGGMTNLAEYIDKLKPNVILRGPIFPELVQVVMVAPMGEVIKPISKGLTTGRLCDPILSPKQLATLEIAPEEESFDGPSSLGRQLKGNSRIAEG